MSNELVKSQVVPAEITESEGYKKVGQERFDVIFKTEGFDAGLKYAELISCIGSDGKIVEERKDADWADENDDGDSRGIPRIFLRVCRKMNENLVANGVKEGDIYYIDQSTQKYVNYGKELTGVIPLHVHNERWLPAIESVGIKDCRSSNAIKGGMGDCNTCKFNSIYRESEAKKGVVLDVPEGNYGKGPASCQFNTVLFFTRRQDPGKLFQISFSKPTERMDCYYKQLLKYVNTRKSESDSSSRDIWRILSPKAELTIKTEAKTVNKNTNWYLSKCVVGEQLYPELFVVMKGMAELAHRYYILMTESSAMKGKMQDEADADLISAPTTKSLSSGKGGVDDLEI